MDHIGAIFLTMCIPLFIVFGLIAFICSTHEKRKEERALRERKFREDQILKESVRIAALCDLNASMGFRNVETLSMHRKLPSRSQFERFDPDAFLVAAIGEDREHYEIWVKDAMYNYKLGLMYEGKLAGLPATQYDDPSWRETESELLDALRHRPDPPKLVLKWSYTSPAGKSCASSRREYTVEDVKKALLQSNGDQHDRTDRQASIARERALMTEGLRYDVLKRGGFKCAICGSTAADGVKLEVDHIVPVSKGGKTEPRNLQVLCDRCNRGKSDKL